MLSRAIEGTLAEAPWRDYRLNGQRCSIAFVTRAIHTLISGMLHSENVLVVSDPQVAMALSLAPHRRLLHIAVGEASKSWQNVESILQRALDCAIDRQGTFIAVGGGALCDSTAFAAAIYLRGIRLILVPTTLLCMVDAAFGGKCGINFSSYKNMVGCYHPAEQIIINLQTLRSLSAKEYRNGLAEVIKSALLGDPQLLGLLEQHHTEILERQETLLQQLVQQSLVVKAAFVTEDYREQGSRAYLNLGHTFAHALESLGEWGKWSHGEAVAWGIAQAMRLGCQLKITEERYAQRIIALLQQYAFQISIDNLNSHRLIEAMQHDKKRVGANIHFVLQRSLAETEIRAVDTLEIEHLLSRSAEES